MALVAASAPHHSPETSTASSLRGLLSWRSVPGFGWIEGVILACFCAIGAYALHVHEAWDDEAQAWLIARDSSVWQILTRRLHYEGAPPLWHLLLHFFHVLGGSYAGIGWLSLAAATAGTYVMLRWSPFPLLIRGLLPFTFFLQYQYAVIARGYVLMPLLIFLMCALFHRREKFLWFALLGGLLANISVQGFVIAGILVALYAFEFFRSRRSHPVRMRWMPAAALLAAMVCVSIYCAIPAPDLSFAIKDEVSEGTVHQVLLKLIAETPRNAERPAPDPPIQGPDFAKPALSSAPRAWLAWQIGHRWWADGATRTFSDAAENVIDALSQATWPIANSNLLACSFLVVLAVWLYSVRQLRMLLPWTALIGLGLVLWTAEHHAGILLVTLIGGVWIAADAPGRSAAPSGLESLFVGLFAFVLLLQVGWSIASIRHDARASYDPGKETAAWLQQHPHQHMAAFHFQTVSIQPWFDASPFYDVPTSWWQWSSNVEVDGIHRSVIAEQPDVVVVGNEFPGDDQIRDQWIPQTAVMMNEEQILFRDQTIRDLQSHGYQETHRFCGDRFARFHYAYRVCDSVFEPKIP